MADKWIEVTDKAERVNHWMLAISCNLLFITGMGMMYKELNFLSFLGLGLVSLKTLHNYLGIVFIIALVRSTAMWWLEAGHFDMPEDWEWIKCAGGYLWHVDKVPETGKYNPGQKLFFLTVVAYGALMGATGLIMWIQPSLLSMELLRWMYPAHALGFVVLFAFFFVHLYLGTIGNPGTLSAMINGTCTKAWARKQHPGWLKEMEEADRFEPWGEQKKNY
jgi:formate dehydrogenase subunit gamma